MNSQAQAAVPAPSPFSIRGAARRLRQDRSERRHAQVLITPAWAAKKKSRVPFVVRAVFWGGVSVLALTWVLGRLLHRTLVGKWRDIARPVWLCVLIAAAASAAGPGWSVLVALVLAAVGPLAWWAPWSRSYAWWPAAGLLGRLAQVPVRRHWMSTVPRQRYAVGFAVSALLWVLAFLPIGWSQGTAIGWLVLAVGVWVPHAMRYSWLREKGGAGAIERLWSEDVVPHVPIMAGSRLRAIEETQQGAVCNAVVVARRGVMASQLVSAVGPVTSALEQVPGAVSIFLDPDLPMNEARMVWTAGRPLKAIQAWTGPTLQADGRFVAGVTSGGELIRARLWAPDGARHFLAAGTTGSGKSGFSRLVLTEAALCDRAFIFYVDGKGGTSVPEAHAGCDVVAIRPEDWAKTVLAVLRLLKNRQLRLSDAGQSSFTPTPTDPLVMLWIEEVGRTLGCDSRMKSWLLEISALGRSLGVSLGETAQTALGDELGGVLVRNNLIGGGTTWAGRAGGGQASRLTAQGADVNLTLLPSDPGSAYLLGGAVDGEPQISRAPWIDNDVARERNARPSRAVLQEADVEGIWDAEHDGLDDQDLVDEDAALIAGPAEGAQVVIPPVRVPKEAPGRARVRLELLKAGDAGLLLGEIEDVSKVSRTRVRTVLKELKAEGLIEQKDDKRWRAAA